MKRACRIEGCAGLLYFFLAIFLSHSFHFSVFLTNHAHSLSLSLSFSIEDSLIFINIYCSQPKLINYLIYWNFEFAELKVFKNFLKLNFLLFLKLLRFWIFKLLFILIFVFILFWSFAIVDFLRFRTLIFEFLTPFLTFKCFECFNLRDFADLKFRFFFILEFLVSSSIIYFRTYQNLDFREFLFFEINFSFHKTKIQLLTFFYFLFVRTSLPHFAKLPNCRCVRRRLTLATLHRVCLGRGETAKNPCRCRRPYIFLIPQCQPSRNQKNWPLTQWQMCKSVHD